MARFASTTIPQTPQYWPQQKRSTNLFVIGNTGTGKSSLINRMIGENVAAEAFDTVEMGTITLRAYTHPNGDITFWDSPGLRDGTGRDDEYISELEKRGCADADLILYCIKMSNTRFRREDHETIMNLTKRLGESIWVNSIFVLTFANDVILRLNHQHKGKTPIRVIFMDLVSSWKDILIGEVENAGVNCKIAKCISVVPAGYEIGKLLPDDDKTWVESLWNICVERRWEPSQLPLQQDSSHNEIRSKLDKLRSYSEELDKKMAELCVKDKEWQQSEERIFELEGSWQSKRLEWEKNQKKRLDIMNEYEKIVEDQCRNLRNYILGVSSLLNSPSDQEMMKQTQEAVVMTAAADRHLQYGRISGSYLDGLMGHIGNLQDQQIYLKSFWQDLLSRKQDLEQSLEKLNELKAISDECNRDIEECGKALSKCDQGLKECKDRIQKVKERLGEVQGERERIMEEVSRCEVLLRSSTKDLEYCQDRVKRSIDKLEKRSKELDGSIVNAATGVGAATGAATGTTVVGIGVGIGIAAAVTSSITFLPLLPLVVIGAATAGAIGAAVGRSKGNSIEQENEEKRRRLKECQLDLERCDDIIDCLHKIVNKCLEEVDNMKKIIANAHHHRY